MAGRISHTFKRLFATQDGPSLANDPEESSKIENRKEVISIAQRELLQGKTWRYLRYLHFRQTIEMLADEIETVCICGSGHGIAELAVAAEFPHLKVTLTDIKNKAHGYPNYHDAMALAWSHGIDNINFSIWNVLKKTDRKFDLVASTEMLEHIEDDVRAASNMRRASKKYTYCLVPYATKAENDDSNLRAKVLKSHEHYVVGYDAETLEALFPRPITISGTYWQNDGLKWRQMMQDLSSSEIDARLEELKLMASDDLREELPDKSNRCLGVKIVSRASRWSKLR